MKPWRKDSEDFYKKNVLWEFGGNSYREWTHPLGHRHCIYLHNVCINNYITCNMQSWIARTFATEMKGRSLFLITQPCVTTHHTAWWRGCAGCAVQLRLFVTVWRCTNYLGYWSLGYYRCCIDGWGYWFLHYYRRWTNCWRYWILVYYWIDKLRFEFRAN